MKKKKLFLIAFFLLAGYTLCFGQNQRVLDSLLTVLKKAKEDTNKVNILIKLSEEAYNYSPDTTKLYAQLALKLSEKLNFIDGRIQSLNSLGNTARTSSDFSLALSYINQSLKIAEQSASKRGMIKANISLGYTYDDMGDISHANECFLKAMKLAEEINDKKYINLANVGFTAAYINAGDNENAMLYALKGLKMSEEMNDKKYISVYEFDIAIIYQTQKKFDEALKHLFIALKIQEETGAKGQLIRTYYRTASCYKNLKKYYEAVRYYNLTKNLSAEMKNNKWMAAAIDGIGQVLMLEEKYRDAIPFFQEEISIAEEINDKEGMSIGYGNIGWAYQKAKNFDEALKYLNKSLVLAKEMGIPENVIDSYDQLAACYYDKKDYKNAYDYLVLYQDSNDSLRNKEVTNKTAELEAKYNNEKKEKEIALLNKDKEIKESKLKKQKILINSFILGAILLIALSFFIFYNFRTKNKLRLQSIRNKIASDLHDDIGSTLNSISVFSEVAKQKSPTVVQELEQIGDASRKIIDAMSDIVWTINPKNDSFENIILRMRSFSYNLLKAKIIEHTFRVDENLNSMKLSMEERRNFFLIFKEAVNNLVKYAEATRVSITLLHENNLIKLSVRDNGKGFNIKQFSTGNGLLNMKTRAEEMKAALKIESEPGNGTNIELTLKA